MSKAHSSQWPSSLDKTDPQKRDKYKKGPGFHVKEKKALRSIESRLGKHGATNININILNPEVVVTYIKDNNERVIGSDNYDNVRDNAQAIAKYINAKRAIERYGVKTPQEEWSNTQLPVTRTQTSSDSLFSDITSTIVDVFGTESRKEIAREVDKRGLEKSEAQMILGVDSNATEQEIKDAAREIVKDIHPDKGGDEDQFKAVMNAKSELLDL